MQRVTYWIFNYEPRWEAISKELTFLAAQYGDFVAAVEQLRDHYDRYQSRCHDVVSATFRKDVFLRKYMSIYQDMAEETT